MPFYDPYTGQEVETEEERQRREQEELRRKELADTAVQTQEIKTYGDGTVERIIKQEIAPEMQPAKPIAPVAPVGTQPLTQPQPRAMTVSPEQAAYTRQQESGGRANIGYHFPANAQGQRQSTAFGPYGITAPAYKDIVRQDPSLNKPITEWTQEDHDRGYNTLVGRNQARLTQLGVEPTNGALQLSHLLGPDGAARFMKTGEVSAAAAAANGGMERLKQIAQGRFAGAPSASSGAAQQTQPMGFQGQTNEFGGMEEPRQAQPVSPESMYSLATGQGQPGIRSPGIPAGQPTQAPTTQYQNQFQSIQDNVKSLNDFIENADTPEYLKRRAVDRRYELVNNSYQESKAKEAMANLGPNDMAKVLTKKSEGNSVGDWLQYLLFKHVGLTDLANQKGEQLGIGQKWTTSTITDENGKENTVELLTSANGRILQGNIAGTGEALTPVQLQQAVRGGALGKGTSLSAEVYIDPNTGRRYRSGYDSSGKTALIDIQGGPSFKGDPKGLVLQSIGAAAARAEAVNAVELRYTGPKAYTRAGADFAGKFNAENGTNIGYATETPGAPLIDKNTGKEVVPDKNGNITATKVGGGTVTQAGAPATAPAPAAASNVPLDKLPKAPVMNPGESPSAFAARTKAWAETYGKQYESREKNVKAAKDLLPYVADMKKLIDQSTSSGFGAILDSAGNFVGYSTAGANAISAIAPLANKVLMGVERFEGPQSDQDVKSYKEAAGRLADPKIPAAQKQAAFNTIVEIMKRNAPDLNWDSVSGQQGNSIKIIKREKI